MTKQRPQDPRETKCPVNQYGRHRWAKAHVDKITKTQWVQIIRCRYCANYLGIELNRIVLPSGRVAIDQRVFETRKPDQLDATTEALRDGLEIAKHIKHIENQAHLTLRK